MFLPESIVEDFRDYPSEKGTGYLQTWIRVHFDQRKLEFVIQHEIITEELKDYEGKLKACLPQKSLGVSQDLS